MDGQKTTTTTVALNCILLHFVRTVSSFPRKHTAMETGDEIYYGGDEGSRGERHAERVRRGTLDEATA